MHSFPTQSQSLPEDLVYSLPSIVEPLDLSDLFPASQPLEIELGSGDGSFLLAYAHQHPERNFIGVERLMGRIRKLDRKGRRLGLRNLRGVRIESVYFLQYLLPPGSTEAMHVYFPDPWPKKKHQKNRLINDGFPALAERVLRPGGLVHLRTDDQDYFQQMREVFAGSSAFVLAETPAELLAVQTDFESDFAAQGIAANHASYRLNG
jgi:tRNA (guanine-N7-)-methyltransferase